MRDKSNGATAIAAKAAILALIGMAACAPTGSNDDSLAMVCQLKTCECVPAGGLVLGRGEAQPVLWTQDGKAHCPEGLALRRAGHKSDFVKRYGG